MAHAPDSVPTMHHTGSRPGDAEVVKVTWPEWTCAVTTPPLPVTMGDHEAGVGSGPEQGACHQKPQKRGL